MQALYTPLVWLVAAAHFAFLAYLPTGGFLALRWRRTIAAHIAAVGWAVGSVMWHFWCPLTTLEQWARRRAGMAPLTPSGFIDHHITGVLYPAAATGFVQAIVFASVVVSWIAYSATRAAARPGHRGSRIRQANRTS